MIFRLDAQLPPALAGYLSARFGVQALPIRDLGLREASDELIFQQARAAGAILITKDHDFVRKSLRAGAPPQIVWLTCGNCSNARLRELFERRFPDVLGLLAAGEPVVELTGGA
ncbi:MAG: DUF5615 family PIN-like protein [Thiobacillaceae bacterium]|nr:DUF5615 family PIN-like protein [Thiobacillaceae bacterium]MDW8323723.1 DUF5615 family PIN-like protein [Burkholderiales bacterium]